MAEAAKIIYTETDEAPALATHSLLPILQAFTKDTGIELETWDISLSGRIIANFPDNLTEEQKIPDYLRMCGELCLEPSANLVKLPNISASIPQLKSAIAELQAKGYNVPEYPDQPANDAEREIQVRYSRVLGSAVNPVIREGNSDRRSSTAVKEHGKRNPHRMMQDWPDVSRTRVGFMSSGDFFGSEQAVTTTEAGSATIEFVGDDGNATALKSGIPIQAGEILDCAVMNVRALRQFYAEELASAKAENVLISLHVKTTMMRVSDPIIFGHFVGVYFQDIFDKYADELAQVAVDPDNGVAELLTKIQGLPEATRAAIESDIQAVYDKLPGLSMVDSNRGITNLHVSSDTIIDASMPVIIRDGGRSWGPNNELQDTIALIPDRSYATIYQAVIEDCQKNGALDPAALGSVANVGLMAQAAEEYGSHDKTFEAPGNGRIRVVDASGAVLMDHQVEEGDIFRMCQTKDAPIQDWVRLGVVRARMTGQAAIFWLDPTRGHDAELLKKVEQYLPLHDTSGLEISSMPPDDAMKTTLERSRNGLDTIAVTGNVLRDYLTDLFPILELGTSAKMLSVVPLLNGGGLFETGAGGSAPRHVQQFVEEGHLRWDSLGEFCAMVASFEHFGEANNSDKARILAETLDQGIGKHLDNNRAPSRRVNELDTRGSHFYLALYWAQALAAQDKDPELKARFTDVAKQMAENEEKIVQELNQAQGKAMDIGGYYRPVNEMAAGVMRPSATLNAILAAV
ncbi:MAG: NADP-dependent isocitrate dehydrogenase [Chloroflexota bacterium]|nr:NADP-dependent isocitrate dehydrogenase [Chloroflexota bacterium]